MFERYTERARRVLFFARYEASQFGNPKIESEHFLLGLFREDKNLMTRFVRSAGVEDVRKNVESRTTIREKVPTSIDLPLSDECKRFLRYAAEEAQSLNHLHIGTEHLLLAILREEKCLAAQILYERGLRVNAIREELARSVVGGSGMPADPPHNDYVPDGDTAIKIAEAVLIPIHGREAVEGQRPFKAGLATIPDGEYWTVTGHTDPDQPALPLQARIRSDDGRILELTTKQPAQPTK